MLHVTETNVVAQKNHMMHPISVKVSKYTEKKIFICHKPRATRHNVCSVMCETYRGLTTEKSHSVVIVCCLYPNYIFGFCRRRHKIFLFDAHSSVWAMRFHAWKETKDYFICMQYFHYKDLWNSSLFIFFFLFPSKLNDITMVQ